MGKRAEQSENVQRAKALLLEQAPDAHETFDLAMTLKAKEHRFGYARRLLEHLQKSVRIEEPSFRTRLRQQLALCTYKDLGIPDSQRFDQALRILATPEELRSTADQETLGIAGAIYKYKWRALGQRQDLEASLNYYRRGYQRGIQNDHGYTAINAAFIFDLLAEEEAQQLDRDAETYCQHVEIAKNIRRQIVEAGASLLAEKRELERDWWFQVTMAEAYFGLGEYQRAIPSLDAARALPDVSEWEYETTARQLASLARLLMKREGRESQLVESLTPGGSWKAFWEREPQVCGLRSSVKSGWPFRAAVSAHPCFTLACWRSLPNSMFSVTSSFCLACRVDRSSALITT